MVTHSEDGGNVAWPLLIWPGPRLILMPMDTQSESNVGHCGLENGTSTPMWVDSKATTSLGYVSTNPPQFIWYWSIQSARASRWENLWSSVFPLRHVRRACFGYSRILLDFVCSSILSLQFWPFLNSSCAIECCEAFVLASIAGSCLFDASNPRELF